MILVDKDRIEVAHLPIRIADPSSTIPLPRTFDTPLGTFAIRRRWS